MTPARTLSLLSPVPPLAQKSTLIKLAHIRAAEKVEEKSFGSSHVMQVIYTDDAGRSQTAYLQCKVWARPRGHLQIGVLWENAWVGWNEDRVNLPPLVGRVRHSGGVKSDVSAACVSPGGWVPGRPCPCLCVALLWHPHIGLGVVWCVDWRVPTS